MRHGLVRDRRPRSAVVPVTWQPRLDDGSRPSQQANCTAEALDSRLQSGQNRMDEGSVETGHAPSSRSEGNIAVPSSLQADPHSEEDANDGGGAARPIARRQGVWLYAG